MRPLNGLEHHIQVAEVLVGGFDLHGPGKRPVLPPLPEVEGMASVYGRYRHVADHAKQVRGRPELGIAPLPLLIGRQVLQRRLAQLLELAEQAAKHDLRRRDGAEGRACRSFGLSDRLLLGRQQTVHDLRGRQSGHLLGREVVEAESAGTAAGRVVADPALLRLAVQKRAPEAFGVSVHAFGNATGPDAARIVRDPDLGRAANECARVEMPNALRHAAQEVPEPFALQQEVARHRPSVTRTVSQSVTRS